MYSVYCLCGVLRCTDFYSPGFGLLFLQSTVMLREMLSCDLIRCAQCCWRLSSGVMAAFLLTSGIGFTRYLIVSVFPVYCTGQYCLQTYLHQ